MKKTLSILLFILSIVVVPLSFYVACLVGEISVFGIMGVVKYSYIMYAFGCIIFVFVLVYIGNRCASICICIVKDMLAVFYDLLVNQ